MIFNDPSIQSTSGFSGLSLFEPKLFKKSKGPTLISSCGAPGSLGGRGTHDIFIIYAIYAFIFVTHDVYVMIRVNMKLMCFVCPFHVFHHNGLQTISHLFGDVPVSQVTKLATKKL